MVEGTVTVFVVELAVQVDEAVVVSVMVRVEGTVTVLELEPPEPIGEAVVVVVTVTGEGVALLTI